MNAVQKYFGTKQKLLPFNHSSFCHHQVVKPVCPTKTVWCPLIGKCSNKCNALLEMQTGPNASAYTCGTTTGSHFCSQEETCANSLVCPSFCKFF